MQKEATSRRAERDAPSSSSRGQSRTAGVDLSYPVRLARPGRAGPTAGFESLRAAVQRFDVTLHALSRRGLTGRIAGRPAGGLRRGDLYWVTLNLPDEPRPTEFVARLKRWAVRRDAQGVTARWQFCGTEDGARLHERIERVARGWSAGAAEGAATARLAKES